MSFFKIHRMYIIALSKENKRNKEKQPKVNEEEIGVMIMSQTIREQVREIPGATLKYVEELFGEEMDKILGLARLLKVKAGKRFITQNDEIRGIYILIAGKVNVLEEYRTGDVYIFQENTVPSIFGEMEIIADMEGFLASLLAKTDCLLVVIPKNVYTDFIRRHPQILYQRAQFNLKDLLTSGRDNRLYLQLQSTDRMKLYMIRKYKRKDTEEHCVLSMTKQEIADEIGYSQKTVLRALKVLDQEGYLTVSGHKILIKEEQYRKMVDSIEQITCDSYK